MTVKKKSTKRLKASQATKPAALPNAKISYKNKSFADKKKYSDSSVIHETPESYEVKEGQVDSKLRFIDLFAGIGGIRLGLERAGGKCVFSSEWDSEAAKTYETYFGEKPAGDITKIQTSEVPDHDILAGGFPCQAFSIIGGMKGFRDTRGTLFFEIERILRAKHPRAFLLENVRNLVSHDKGQTFKVILEHLKNLGYHVYWRILNALEYNLPQKRERVIIVGFKENHPFEWPKCQPLKKTLAALLEPDEVVNKKHFASEPIRLSVKARLAGKKLPPAPWICHENKAGNISPLPYSCALRAGASYNYLLVNGRRRLTPRENLRLQGFPEDFPTVVPDSAIRKQCGNSVPVSMIEAVSRQIVAALNEKPLQVNGTPIRVDEGQFELVFPGVP
jgi:DNA (cytosine-5)-methyltransferase 1